MGLFSNFKMGKEIKAQDLPWDNLPSVFNHINANIDGAGRLAGSGYTLPDEERRYDGKSFRWAAGAGDGSFRHYSDSEGAEQQAATVANLVKAIAVKNTLREKVALYKLLIEDSLLGFVDAAFEQIFEDETFVGPHLRAYARWLAFESPDRGAVKFGIALLGVIRDQEDVDKIITLAKHEEFTLFSAVAIQNMREDWELVLWDLAKYVDGWGKIHLVERLSATQHAEIKKWLLRDGYRNSVSIEYLAYTCAVAGDLKNELLKSEITEDVFRAAGDIIEALIQGGPAETIDHYDDGAEVTSLYIAHAPAFPDKMDVFLKLTAIRQFLESEDVDWTAREKKGWTMDLRSNVLIDLHAILSDPKWRQMVIEKQDSQHVEDFWYVDQAAEILGISLWETHWKRLVQNPTDVMRWHSVMKNANHERIDQIVALALASFPLAEIATGAADEAGLGEKYSMHRRLDFFLQDLGNYPGKGFELLRAALKSPVTRNRNMAMKALSEWGMENWPEGTYEMLVRAAEIEPNEDTKENLNDLLAGRPIE